MNRYHFNFRSGDQLFPDRSGMYLPSDEDAFEEAIRTGSDLSGLANQTGEKRDGAIEIMDADGTVIGTIPLGYAERWKDP
jgi:hypothetical protein